MSKINGKALFVSLIIIYITIFTSVLTLDADDDETLNRKIELRGMTWEPDDLVINNQDEIYHWQQKMDRSNLRDLLGTFDYIEKITSFYDLSDKQKEALERVPDWMKFDFIDAMRRLENHGDTYADLLLSVEEKLWWDEIAFIISHSETGLLTSSKFDPELIIRNVELVYLYDEDLQYVEVIDHGVPGIDKDFYTTTKYRIKDGENFEWMEIDKDIYYWYVVHPKMGYENPSWTEEISDAGSTYGYFWREYLYYNPSSEYDYQEHYILNHPNVITPSDVNDWGYSAQGYLQDLNEGNHPKQVINDQVSGGMFNSTEYKSLPSQSPTIISSIPVDFPPK